MATVLFDSSEIVEDLKKEGVSPKHAKAFVDAIVRTQKLTTAGTEKIAVEAAERDKTLAALQAQFKALEESRKEDAKQAATKGDLRELDAKLTGEIALVRKDMDALGNKLIIRLTVAIGALIGLAFAAQRYLPPPH